MTFSAAARELGPNWYASVMGTGIVAVAATSLPGQLPGMRTAATVVWALAAGLLVLLTVIWAAQWVGHHQIARGHAYDPVRAQSWGAPSMAMLTVGAGALVLGADWIGASTALAVAWSLWITGTLLGLVTTVWIPYLMMTSHRIRPDSAFGGWLMPVVPPMVSAATGAALIPSLPPGQGRLTMLFACYAMFGISLLATLFLVPQIWQRLVLHKMSPTSGVPTVWIVLGPLGQSVTAANLLADVAPTALPPAYGDAADLLGLVYGVPVWGFAMVWLALAAALTIRAARTGLPFASTWWAFTFPLGTCVTGTSALAAHTHATMFSVVAIALYVLLVLAWLTVATRTVLSAVRRPTPTPSPTTAPVLVESA